MVTDVAVGGTGAGGVGTGSAGAGRTVVARTLPSACDVPTTVTLTSFLSAVQATSRKLVVALVLMVLPSSVNVSAGQLPPNARMVPVTVLVAIPVVPPPSLPLAVLAGDTAVKAGDDGDSGPEHATAASETASDKRTRPDRFFMMSSESG